MELFQFFSSELNKIKECFCPSKPPAQNSFHMMRPAPMQHVILNILMYQLILALSVSMTSCISEVTNASYTMFLKVYYRKKRYNINQANVRNICSVHQHHTKLKHNTSAILLDDFQP